MCFANVSLGILETFIGSKQLQDKIIRSIRVFEMKLNSTEIGLNWRDRDVLGWHFKRIEFV